ncbi:MAG: hypothetical protein ACI4PF_05670 [Christensenellales bacterium]
MKKSTLILIMIIYVASIVVINFFGLNVKVYDEVINVTGLECINETDEKANVVINDKGIKEIRIKFSEPANIDTKTGTMYQLKTRVYPDNADNKNLKYVYAEHKNVEFYKDGSGRETGLVLFYGTARLEVKIMSTDGQNIYTTIIFKCY